MSGRVNGIQPVREVTSSWHSSQVSKPPRRRRQSRGTRAARRGMGADKADKGARGVTFVTPGWTHSKQYALRPGFPTAWGGGCRESIAYKRAKTPPRLINGASTALLMRRGGCACVYA